MELNMPYIAKLVGDVFNRKKPAEVVEPYSKEHRIWLRLPEFEYEWSYVLDQKDELLRRLHAKSFRMWIRDGVVNIIILLR